MSAFGAVLLLALVCVAATAVKYKAAVIELPSVNGQTPAETRRLSAAESVRYAGEAARAGADIIVFPEYGVTGFASSDRGGFQTLCEEIPDPAGDVPCSNPSRYQLAPSIVTLSCGARDHGIAIVAAMSDVKYCQGANQPPSCARSSDGRVQFNTAVAFDTDGKFVAKHHKQNLWGEDAYVDIPQTCKKASFTASFNVTFGIFVCADAIHGFPAETMVRESGIRNFAVPIAWSNDMAQMQALPWFQGWSLRNGANAIVANHPWHSGDGWGSSGTGIMSNGRPLASVYSMGATGLPLLIAELDSEPQPAALPAQPPLPTQRGSSVGTSSWQLVPLSAGHVCSGRICCVATGIEGETTGYVLAALDGEDGSCGFNTVCSQPSLNWPGQVCAVLACQGPTQDCHDYQILAGSITSPLRRLRLDVNVSEEAVVYPHVLGSKCFGSSSPYLGCPDLQVLYTPGLPGDFGFAFQENGTRMSLDVRLPPDDTLASAILYGRLYGAPYESLQYTCPWETTAGPTPAPAVAPTPAPAAPTPTPGAAAPTPAPAAPTPSPGSATPMPTPAPQPTNLAKAVGPGAASSAALTLAVWL